jgi:DNA-binding transcriptional LysR family regulator
MLSRDIADLLIFQVVADTGSFTRAAAQLGRAQSGVSQSVRALEERLGVPLLARSTRSVRLTEAGKRLLELTLPALREVETGLSDAAKGHDRVSGTLRITVMEHPARKLLIPVLRRFADAYPEVTIDLHVSDRFTDIVEAGFDAGVRFGSHLEKDMVSVPISGDIRAAVVAAPDYFESRGRPERPEDLAGHDCINYRTASHGDLFRWMFRDGDKTIELPVSGRMLVNDGPVMIEAALAGLGLAYTFEPHVAEHLESGRLEKCLDAFCPVWSGYSLFFPSRHQKSPALSAFVQHLRRHRSRPTSPP